MCHRCACVCILALLSGSPALQSQTVTDSGNTPPRHWYDTLTVTRPKSGRMNATTRLAMTIFTAVSIPIGAAFGIMTVFPPSVSMLAEDGSSHTGIAMSAGTGFGKNGTPLLYYPDFRVQIEAAYYFLRRHPLVWRLSLLRDFTILPVHQKKFIWLTVALGAGAASDFHSAATPYLEGFCGVSNPLGIRYMPLYPMHNLGIRVRAGRKFSADANWYEVSLCATGTFGWFE